MVVGAPGFEGAADFDPTKRFRDFVFLFSFSTMSEAIVGVHESDRILCGT